MEERLEYLAKIFREIDFDDKKSKGIILWSCVVKICRIDALCLMTYVRQCDSHRQQ